VPKENTKDELFNCDKPDWSYEGVKIAYEAEKKKAFDLKNKKVKDPDAAAMDEIAARSDDELSYSDDEEGAKEKRLGGDADDKDKKDEEKEKPKKKT